MSEGSDRILSDSETRQAYVVGELIEAFGKLKTDEERCETCAFLIEMLTSWMMSLKRRTGQECKDDAD